jgi:alkylated DNA repair dioxygenase AlkB
VYEDNFLTTDEADEFESACQGLDFVRRKNPRNSTLIRNENILWCDIPATHAQKTGIPRRALSEAPEIFHTIVARLSERLGRTVNYVSLMKYVGGKDHINFHQHSEDHGHDTPVAIVSTGAERNFSYRLKGMKGRKNQTNILARRGSIIVLPSEFNTTHEHGVLDDSRVTGVSTRAQNDVLRALNSSDLAAVANALPC